MDPSNLYAVAHMVQPHKNYTFSVKENGLLLVTNYKGRLTIDIILQSSKDRMALPEFESAQFSIFDVSQATVSAISPIDLYKLAEHMRGVVVHRPLLVVILMLSHDKLSYGLSRILLAAAKRTTKNFYIARGLDAAMEIVTRIREERNI